MKKSIRLRITCIFIAITTVLIAALFLANVFFLSSYYRKEKVNVIRETYDTMNDLFISSRQNGISFNDLITKSSESEDSSLGKVLRGISERSNMDIVVLDNESGIMAGLSRESGWLGQKLETYLEFSDFMNSGWIPDSKFKSIEQNENYSIQLNYDPRSGSSNLECWGSFSDTGISFIMSMPVESFFESIQITNKFILIAGIIILVIGSVIIYFATAAITKPINSLAGISLKMSQLNFTEKYNGKSQDEIGILGDSMNKLSDKLEITINDLQKANIKLQKDIDLKEKTDTIRKEFISNVSHELKTPIALIEGYAEGLVEGIAEDEESRKYYCNVIMDEAEKMNKMVKQLTSLTQYEFGYDTLCKEDFDLCDLIRNTLAKEKIRLDEKQAVTKCVIPEHCMVNADEFKIEEVFTNYISNALNHLSGNRNIIIEIISKKDNKVCLSVYNDGVNIPDDSLEMIWDKFYKVDKARTRAYGGSGIGLSIVKAIAEAHGQEYGVQNLPDGVRFYITLDSTM